MSYRSTLSIEIITICIYIQEVWTSGGAISMRSYPSSLYSKGITVCIEIYKNDILLHTAYKHERMQLETILSHYKYLTVYRLLTLRLSMKRLPYSLPLSIFGTVKIRLRKTSSFLWTSWTAFRCNNSYVEIS